jgi:hypothetical protein
MSKQYSSVGWLTAVQLAVLTWVAPAMAQHPAAIPSLSNCQLERLSEGQILVDVAVAHALIGDAIGIINATPEQVIDIIKDFDNYEDFMDDMVLAEILDTPEELAKHFKDGEAKQYLAPDGDLEVQLCHGITHMPWPMEDREWIVRTRGGRTQIDGMDVILSQFTYVPGSGNLKNIDGYWLLIPWGSGGSQTLLRYHLAVDLGTRLPDCLLKWSAENFLPVKVQGIRDRFAWASDHRTTRRFQGRVGVARSGR